LTAQKGGVRLTTMKKILFLCGIIAIAACKSKQTPTEGNMYTGEVDAQVEKLLSGKEIYADATRVIPVLVNGEAGSGEKKENLEGFAVTKKGPPLSPAQVTRLQTVIFNKATYDFNSQKRCAFHPYVGFIFETAGKQAHALFCFSCSEVAFGRNAAQGNIEDFDAARAEVISIAREIFPADPKLAALK